MRTRQGAPVSLGMTIIPEDIYRYFILDDGFETARFQGLPRIKRKQTLSLCNNLPPRFRSWKTHGVSLYAKLVKFDDMAIDECLKNRQII